MIGHQAIGIAEPVKALGDLGKGIEKKLPVGIAPKDGFLFVPREVMW